MTDTADASPDVPPCAVRSIEAGESLAATASRVDEWVLYRRDGAWGEQALTESGLPGAIGQLLRSIDRRPRTKAILVRGTVASDDGPHAVIRARSTVGDLRLQEFGLSATPAAEDVASLSTQVPAAWAPGDDLLLAVCTNGRHDQCCANLGRPLVRAFRAIGEPVWECSHIGGDRFAGNVLVLPHGLYFGRVDPATVDEFLATLRAGLLPLEHYRGRSALPMPAQAAEIAVREHLGDRHIDALTGWRLQAAGDGRWAASIDLAGATHDVEVSLADPTEPRLLTCDAVSPSPPRHFTCGPVRTASI